MESNILYIFNGYCDKISYNTNEIVHVYANGNDDFENINIDIKDLKGDIVKTIFVEKLFRQTEYFYGLPNSDYWSGFIPKFKNKTIEKPWEDFCYDESFSFDIKDFKSGIYLIGKKIKFIVKGDSNAPITYLYASNTEAAYNGIGGKSLYYDWQTDSLDEPNKALVVGFKRPVLFTPKYDNNCEFGEIIDEHQHGFLNWLVKQDYNVNYICDMDMDDLNNINDTNVLIIGGHSEYWTMKARENLELIINNGTNILNLSGNTLWWCVEYVENNTKIVCIRNKESIDSLDKKYIDENKNLLNTIQFIQIENKNIGIDSDFETKNELDKQFINKLRPLFVLGADYLVGGYGKINTDIKLPYYNLIYDNKNIILNGVENNKLFLNYQEFDGIYTNIIDNNENHQFSWSIPTEIINIENIINKVTLDEKIYSFFQYKKIIMIGIIEYPSNTGCLKRFSGIIAVKKNDKTGTIINTCCMDWCHTICFDGKSGNDIKIITKNCINILLENSNQIFN